MVGCVNPPHVVRPESVLYELISNLLVEFLDGCCTLLR